MLYGFVPRIWCLRLKPRKGLVVRAKPRWRVVEVRIVVIAVVPMVAVDVVARNGAPVEIAC